MDGTFIIDGIKVMKLGDGYVYTGVLTVEQWVQIKAHFGDDS